MPRWVTTLIGFAVVALAFWLVARTYQAPQAIGREASPHAEVDAGPSVDGGAGQPAPTFGGTAMPSEDSGAFMLSDLANATAESTPRGDGGVGASLPDGSPVPPLPMNAPRQVRFGVVLVSYGGAQPSPGGARPSSRSRADAKALAAKLLATAQQDFHAAVQQGDAGSSDDVGRVKLGVLEPGAEYVLFASPVGTVSGPVDTPRGYWIVKRLE